MKLSVPSLGSVEHRLLG